MEKIIFEEEKQRIQRYFKIPYQDFLDFFIKYENVYDYIAKRNNDVQFESINNLRPSKPVNFFYRSINYKNCKEVNTFNSVVYYLRKENKEFNELINYNAFSLKRESKNKINAVEIYKTTLIKTLSSIYNCLCELSELSSDKIDNNKFVIIEACPLDMDQLKTRIEAITLKHIVLYKTSMMPVIRIGTNKNEFSRIIKYSNIKYIHFCGHGDRQNIILMGIGGYRDSLHEAVFINEIKRNIGNSINLIFLNCCLSSSFAQHCKFYLSNLSYSIGTLTSINDKIATRYSTEFYDLLFSKSPDIESAYNTIEDEWETSSDNEEQEHADSIKLYK